MSTTCEKCGHKFVNVMLRQACPRCGHRLGRPATDSGGRVAATDDAFDVTGFALGMATGVPLSPTHGVSTGALLGAALHGDPAPSAPACDPAPSTRDDAPSSGSCDGGGSSGDSGSSSSGGGSDW